MIDRLLAKVFGTQHERDLKKLESDLEMAYEDFGRAAFALREAGTLSSADLEPESLTVRDAQAAHAGLQAEIAALREDV